MTPVRRPRTRLALSVLPLLLSGAMLSACGSETAEEEPNAKESPVQSEEPIVEPDQPSDLAEDSPLVKKAVADLAKREKAESDTIEVVATESVTWSDSSLGCAEEGMMYAQALVEGHRITLKIGDTEYEYHSGRRKDPFYCAEPTQ